MITDDTGAIPKKRHSFKRLGRYKSNPTENLTELPSEFISRSTSKDKKKRRSLTLPPLPTTGLLENKEVICPPISSDALKVIHKPRSASLTIHTSSSSTESLRSYSMMDISPPYSPGKLQVGSGSRSGIHSNNETRIRPTFHRNKQSDVISNHRTEVTSRENSDESRRSLQKPIFGSSSSNDSDTSNRPYLRKPPESVAFSEYKDGILCLNTMPFDDVTFCFICEKDFIVDVSHESDCKSASNQLISKDLLKKMIVVTGYKIDPMPVYRQIYVCSDCHEHIKNKENDAITRILTESNDITKIIEQKKCVLCTRAKVYYS